MSLVHYEPTTQLATFTSSGNAWVDLVAPAAELANKIANTEFVPQEMRGKPAAVAACILYGSEIGIGPMQSLAKVDIVKGRPAPKAELARALALAAGHEIRVEESTNTKVTVAGRRAGTDFWQRVTWTMDDVKKAGIVNQAYSKYPRQMLLARASAELVRAMCPDVLGGIGQFAEEIDGADVPVEQPTAQAPTTGTTRRRKPLNMTATTPAELPPLPTDEPAETEPIDAEVLEGPPPVTDAQLRKMMACFSERGIRDRAARLSFVFAVIGREVESSKELTLDEASAVIDALESIGDEP